MHIQFLFQQETGGSVRSATESARNTVVEMVNSFWAQLPVIAVGLVVLLVFLVIASIARRIIKKAAEKSRVDLMIASLLSRIVFFVIVIFGLLVSIVVIFPGVSVGNLFSGLGIGSVALGFAFKEVLQNLLAGFLILLYRPFHIGDQIKVNDFEGTVDEINVRATLITTYDGEQVVIPNTDLFMNAVVVRTAFPFRRTSVVIGIGYDDDHEEARRVLLNVLKNTEGVVNEPAPDVNVVELAGSSVNLKLLFWTDSAQSSIRKTSDRVVSAAKKALNEANIDIPYEHIVIDNAGKSR